MNTRASKKDGHRRSEQEGEWTQEEVFIHSSSFQMGLPRYLTKR